MLHFLFLGGLVMHIEKNLQLQFDIFGEVLFRFFVVESQEGIFKLRILFKESFYANL
jgi:hypothetical protein